MEIVICSYTVKPGKETEFLNVVKRHWPTLDRLELVAQQPRLLLRGTGKENANEFVEIYAWKDAESARTAHQAPAVLALWEPMEQICESVKFPHYAPVAL